VNNDKRIAKQLLDEQGFDVDEERIHIPSKKRRDCLVTERILKCVKTCSNMLKTQKIH